MMGIRRRPISTRSRVPAFISPHRFEVDVQRKRKSESSFLSVHWPVIFLGTAVIALLSGVAYKVFYEPAANPGPAIAEVPVYYNRAEDAMPFPATLEPASFKGADVREAYQTAKEIPEVLAQQPCYCYCQRKGHRSLLDCFKTDHAASCNICVKEGLLSGQMHRQRKTTQEIRTAIIHGPWANAGDSSR